MSMKMNILCNQANILIISNFLQCPQNILLISVIIHTGTEKTSDVTG